MSAGGWSVEAANAALARLTALVEQARALAADVRAGTADQRQHVSSNGHGRVDPAEQLTNLVDDLEREGIILRDVDSGLIDFAAVAPSGRQYWLCWVVGEPTVDWWHWPEAGFAGRTPLTEPPE
jgi:hypothetical protein